MLQENLTIENFGPLRTVTLQNITPLTVFIGESGSGKSTIMKVLVLFRWIYKKLCIRSYLKVSGITKSPFRFQFDQYKRNNGFEDFFKPDTSIVYSRGPYEISYKNGKLYANITISAQDLSLDKMCFISDKRNVIPDLLAKKIPAGDSFFLNETWHDFQEAARYMNDVDLPYLGVKLVKRKTPNGAQFFVQNSTSDRPDYSIHFESASSGMQNVAPLSYILKYFAEKYDLIASFNRAILSNLSDSDNISQFRPVTDIGKMVYKNLYFHIEEPELSLYPSSQLELLSFIIAECFENTDAQFKMNCMITTHSPYIVNYLNLLIRQKRIAFTDISAFEVINGTVRQLKNESSEVVDTTVLSEPIARIYSEYNGL